MRLVKIDNIYINPDKVAGLTTDHIGGGHYTEVKNDEGGSY